MGKVLYVDDEPAMRDAVATWMRAKGIELEAVESIAAAKRAFGQQTYDGAFIDIALQDGSGFELYAWLEENFPRATRNVLFVTGDVVSAPAVDVIARLGKPAVAKPFDLEELERYARGWTKR
jgi:DNA-binding response OmpR family regulator